MGTNKKVGVVYHFIAHYRLAVFRELMKDKNIDFTLISDASSTEEIKTIDKSLAKESVENGGLRWEFVKNKWFLKNKILWQKRLFSQLKNNSFDTVIFLGNIYYLSTWLAILYLKLMKKDIYLWSHGVTSEEMGLKWAIRKYFYNLSKGIFLYGHNAKQVMINNGFPKSKLHVIYNSLDYNQQLHYRNLIDEKTRRNTKKQLFENDTLPYLVFVGRLTAQKKLSMIIEAIRLLSINNIRVNTLFVGEGDAKKEMEILIKQYHLQNYFKFYGACYDEEKLSHLIGSADICVSPGEVGLTALTALGYGTPVISHGDFNYQMPEYESIQPGFNGELFERDSIADLVNKISKWLSHAKTISRENIQTNCYTIIDEKYNPKNQAAIINYILLNNE